MLSRITPFILTYNEAPNIERTLQALGWAREVVLIDSGSNDDTLEHAARYRNVRIVTRAFDNHAAQFNYALTDAGIDSQWVLALDADYVMTPELIEEIASLRPAPEVGGYRVPFTYCVSGIGLRASLYPPVTVLYRRQAAHYVQDGHTQRVRVTGKTLPLSARMRHDDRKSFKRWLWSQRRYMRLEADMLASTPWPELRASGKLRRLLFAAPLLTGAWCLLGKGLILDGWPGLSYAVQRTIAECMLTQELLRRRFAGATAERQAR